MSITLQNHAGTAVDYNLNRTSADQALYNGPQQTDITTDKLILSSKAPSRTAMSFGNRRSSLNIQRSAEVTTPTEGSEQKVAKIEVLSSIPAGMSESDFNELAARASSALANPALVKAIFTTGQIQF